MGNLIFLVGAVALSVVGSVLLWLRHRPPTSVMSSIEGFREEMSALGGERPQMASGPPARPSSGSARPPTRRATVSRAPSMRPVDDRPPVPDEGSSD